MAPKTIKTLISNTLENLGQQDLEKFRSQLRDRREEPRIPRSKVENKSFLVITDVLVQTFRESGALSVTLQLLRDINCNDEAERLESDAISNGHMQQAGSGDKPEALRVALDIPRQINCNAHAERLDSKAKAFRDNGDPTFRKTSTGEVERCPSQDALKYVLSDLQTQSPKKPREVEAEAKARVLAEGGDPQNTRLVLSRFAIQFGKYKGQTFQWLLENHVGYVAFLVAGKKEDDKMCPENIANKESLSKYAKAYPEFLQVLRIHLADNGQARVGFGCHKNMKLKTLYDSRDPSIISYVEFLRGKQSTCDPGPKMHVAIEYILQRDKARAASQSTSNSTPQVPSATKRKWTPSTRGRFNQAASGSQNKRRKKDMKENYRPSSHY